VIRGGDLQTANVVKLVERHNALARVLVNG